MGQERFHYVRLLLPYTTAAVLIAFVYATWTLWSRYHENRAIERKSETEEIRRDARVLELYGGSDLKILSFYASPPEIRRGERTLLCYGANNATRVRIEPQVDGAGPALSRCLEIHPFSTTTFKLTAEDAKGREATQSVTVRVSERR